MRPNFFIVGAPKCGTTALSVYLGQHPEIFMTVPKEPFFFATDLSGIRKVTTETEYLKLFSTDSNTTPCIGEASTLYLYSSEAIANIFGSNSDSRIVVMLRNPVDLVRSYHSQLVYGLFEDVVEFPRAWELQEERRRGESIPQLCPEPLVLQYGEVGRLGSQLERLLSVFPRDQVHLIVFEDFVNDPAAVYRGTLEFLGARDDGRTRFPRVNENKVFRFRSLAKAKSHIFKYHPWFERLLRRGLTFARMEGAAHRLVSKKVAHRRLSVEMRDTLVRHFESEIFLLGQLLDRDLSHWTHHDADNG